MHLTKAKRRNEIRSNNIDCDIESWYDWLSAINTPDKHMVTFPSVIIPLSPDEATSILHQHYFKYALRKREYTPATLEHDSSILSNLENSIQNNINSITSSSSSGAFIRLFSRSPKDGISVYAGDHAIFIYEEMIKLTRKFYSEDNLFWSSQFQINPKIFNFDPHTFHHARKHKKTKNEIIVEDKEYIIKYLAMALTDWCLLQVFNANEALNLLYSSERVRYDLTLDLERYEKMSAPWDNGIMLRLWDNRIRPDLEFRCFVNNKKLTAISQYDPLGYFPHVVHHKMEIQNSIFKLFDEIKDKVPLDSFVIDLAVIPGNGEKEIEIVVIEINPLDQWTSGALFDWEVDKNILLGNVDFEFRLHTELLISEKFKSVVLKLEDKFIDDNNKIAKHTSHPQIIKKHEESTETEEDENLDMSFLNL